MEEASGGVIILGPGTLYRSMDEMQGAGLVRRAEAPGQHVDPRRKYYRITDRGRSLLQAEMERLQGLVELARERRILGEGT